MCKIAHFPHLFAKMATHMAKKCLEVSRRIRTQNALGHNLNSLSSTKDKKRPLVPSHGRFIRLGLIRQRRTQLAHRSRRYRLSGEQESDFVRPSPAHRWFLGDHAAPTHQPLTVNPRHPSGCLVQRTPRRALMHVRPRLKQGVLGGVERIHKRAKIGRLRIWTQQCAQVLQGERWICQLFSAPLQKQQCAQG